MGNGERYTTRTFIYILQLSWLTKGGFGNRGMKMHTEFW